MHWTQLPRFIADWIAYDALMVPDSWRRPIANGMTVVFWIDLFLLLVFMAIYAA